MRSAKTKNGMARASVTVPPALLAASKAAAKQENRSFSGFVQEALEARVQATKKRSAA